MNKTPWRVAFIGLAHIHIRFLAEDFKKCPDFRVAAAADLPPSRPSLCEKRGTRPWHKNYLSEICGGNIYDDWRELLDKEKPDVVVCCSENTRHAEIAMEILSRGIHMIIQKPLSQTYDEARMMAYTAKKNGIILLTTWPSTWWPNMRLAKELVDNGIIGRIFRIMYRNGRSLGPFSYGQGLTIEEQAAEWWYRKADGGGAYWDYCCYGANLTRWFLETDAISVQAMCANFNTPFAETDDYAAMLVQYPNAAAIIEASWTTMHTGVLNGPVILGLEGTLVVDETGGIAGRVGESLVRVYKDGRPEEIKIADPLPEHRCDIAKELAHVLRTGDKPHPTLDLPINLGAMAILDAGYRSLSTGQRVMLPTTHWI